VSVPHRAAPRLLRRYPRLTLRVDVVIETPAARVAQTATTLGAGGLFVATPTPLELHTLALVRFHLPGDDTELCFDAHVAWSRPPSAGAPGMGLSFDDPDARADLAARLERWADLRDASRSGPSGV
jgi:Tfp pilus assembly protein PilZ